MRKISNLQFIYRRFDKINNKSPISISNNAPTKKRVIFVRSIKPKYGSIEFTIKSSQSSAKILLLNKNFRYVQTIPNNAKTLVKNLDSGSYHVAFTLPPNCEVDITKLSVNSYIDAREASNELLDAFTGDTLLIAPGYPSLDNLYSHAFIHTRMKLYRDHNIGNIDVAIVNDDNINQSSSYSIDGIEVKNLSYNDTRILLHQKKYSRIFVHFFNPKYAQILDASDTSETLIFIYTHGGDVLYRDYPDLFHNYFKDKPVITESLKKDFAARDSILRRYNTYPNVHWIFATKWCLNRAETLLEERFDRSHIISNPILSSVFSYNQRKAEDRKKICVVRPFNRHCSYSIDISVRTILELSKRPFFSDLEFDIYGTGETHELLTKPLLNFSNVNIHNTFLNSNELSRVFQDHGITLMPTRYDTQGVSACEAAMTGSIVISSDGDIGLKECVDPSLGMYCDTENFKDYADRIEEIYKDENKFLETSRKMHEYSHAKCSVEHSIQKEVALLKNTRSYKKEFQLKPKSDKPILTVAVPSYNVEKYLMNGVTSLLDHPLAHKLEILIVNDGSKDNTFEVGMELEKLTTTKNGPIVRIIDKENGGHGSTINKGIELATGRYFRLMDGDDYFITSEFVKLLEKLEDETSDIVLTNYIEDFSIDAFKRPIRHYSFMTPGLQYDLDVMQYHGYGFGDWGPLLSTTTCKTNILKSANFKIDENAFYVDMEYNFMIYTMSKTVVYYPLDIYNYYLGRAGQSMSRESFTRNYLHHEKVTLRLLEEFSARKDNISEGKKQYLINKLIVPMCKTQYMICTEYHASRKPFVSFDKKLKEYKVFYNDKGIAGRLIRLHRSTGGHLIRIHDPMRRVASAAKRFVRI